MTHLPQDTVPLKLRLSAAKFAGLVCLRGLYGLSWLMTMPGALRAEPAQIERWRRAAPRPNLRLNESNTATPLLLSW